MKVGEVYCDNIFDEEVTIVSEEKNTVTLDGPVNGEENRKIKIWRVKHNISVGRYEKTGQAEVEASEQSKEEQDSVFDY